MVMDMDKKDYGKTAMCGVSGQEVIVSAYNIKCPCLNCADCKNEQQHCPWKYVLETNPCTDDDMRLLLCKNCLQRTQASQR